MHVDLPSARFLTDRYDSVVLVYRKGVFCLESEWFGLRSTVSVRPALELLRSSDYHVQYIHRDVATRAESSRLPFVAAAARYDAAASAFTDCIAR